VGVSLTVSSGAPVTGSMSAAGIGVPGRGAFSFRCFWGLAWVSTGGGCVADGGGVDIGAGGEVTCGVSFMGSG